ncbi:MAG TPA: hypothetical protein DDX39_09685 [Bacteroidales bacterium]|nr:MAG: hypothetical protein A2W98_01690 [Bacteroidetes bacterium GWF2_33_38]OFY74351.1 MAG: hypothetical protein A2265_06250 [Bacteroidetes bacterium RIFOXYA12_FULL_33_9]HBF88899.1 hypothetical protein [Bacteroidales bacterium]
MLIMFLQGHQLSSCTIVPDTSVCCREAIIIDGSAFNVKDVDVVTSDIYYNKKINNYFLYKECSIVVDSINNVNKLAEHIERVHLPRIKQENKLVTEKK